MTKSMPDIFAEMEEERQVAARKSNDARHKFILRFCKAMICFVRIEFAGSGDSGQIEEITIEYADGNSYTSESNEEQLRKDLEAWTYNYLEGVDIDWYNNEGGQGEIIFDCRCVPFKFSANVDVNEMISKTEHSVEEPI